MVIYGIIPSPNKFETTMDLFSPWYFAALVCIALLIVMPAGIFSSLDSNPTSNGSRLETLDGLRGLLALAVFAHHAAITYGFTKTGTWEAPPSVFYKLLGQVGVSLFFMITGYLFWTRLLNLKGTPDWLSLYIGRLFRIGPLYLAAVTVALAIVFHRTGWAFHEPAPDISLQVAQWLGLGLFGQPKVNGYEASQLLAGVTWTIYYEWIFYFALPALAVVAAARSHLAIIVTAIWVIPHVPSVFPNPQNYLITLFLCGMLTASIHRKFPALSLKSPVFSVAALCLLGALFANLDTAYGWPAIALLGGFFAMVSSGASLFGFLTSRAARRLGNISYSIYLLHGLTLTIVFSPKVLGTFATSTPRIFWATIALTTFVLTVASITAYLFIERPGIALGKRVAKGLGHLKSLEAPGSAVNSR
jgi:peptidoglycan/LPS O-acetylase OafA/YrhL